MANLVWVSLLISSLFTLVLSQLNQSPQNGWIQPDGTQEDYVLKYYDEYPLKVQWRGWSSNETDSYLRGVTVANLWVTSHSLTDEDANYIYSKVLKTNVNITAAGSYEWKIDISKTILESSNNRFALRFLQSGNSWAKDVPQISSRGFLIVEQPAGATATAATTTTATQANSTTGTATTSATSTSTGTTTSTLTASSSGLSTGAKAGVGVGAGLGGLAVLAGLAFLLARFLRRPSRTGLSGSTAAYHPGSTEGPGDGYIASGYRQELPVENKPPQEMFAPPAELASNPYRR